jgi:PKD repeat protein
MQCSRSMVRTTGLAALLGILTLAGCMLSQPKVTVDIAVSDTEGTTPMVVEFTAMVNGDITTCYWDFGDGETSIDVSPVHVYRAQGTYDVFLTVTLDDGSTGATKKQGLIKVDASPPRSVPLSMLYWLNPNEGVIQRGDRAGSSYETVVSYIYRGKDLAVGAGSIYWVEDDSIRRANYDGSGRETIVTGQLGLASVAVDTVADRIYWACMPSGPFSNTYWEGSLKQANLQGTGRTTLQRYDDSAQPFTWWVRSDADGGKLYRYFDDDNYVRPVRLSPMGLWDGSFQWLVFPTATTYGVHRVRGSLNGITTMAVDVGRGPACYIYWTTGSSIKRCRVDGSDTTTVLSDLNGPKGIAVDVVEGKMYWSDAAGIHRANLDGTEEELIYPGLHGAILVIQEF